MICNLKNWWNEKDSVYNYDGCACPITHFVWNPDRLICFTNPKSKNESVLIPLFLTDSPLENQNEEHINNAIDFYLNVTEGSNKEKLHVHVHVISVEGITNGYGIFIASHKWEVTTNFFDFVASKGVVVKRVTKKSNG